MRSTTSYYKVVRSTRSSTFFSTSELSIPPQHFFSLETCTVYLFLVTRSYKIQTSGLLTVMTRRGLNQINESLCGGFLGLATSIKITNLKTWYDDICSWVVFIRCRHNARRPCTTLCIKVNVGCSCGSFQRRSALARFIVRGGHVSFCPVRTLTINLLGQIPFITCRGESFEPFSFLPSHYSGALFINIGLLLMTDG